MKGNETIIHCVDQKELEDHRNTYKKKAKERGKFLKCESNTIYLKNGDAVTFEIGFEHNDELDFDDEHLPGEAFK